MVLYIELYNEHVKELKTGRALSSFVLYPETGRALSSFVLYPGTIPSSN